MTVISIVLLNWNRLDLLRMTFYSLLATTGSEFELIVIDNNSTDGSREWLRQLEAQYPAFQFIFLNENIGGEAFNHSHDRVRGDFVLFTENDLEYRPDWDRKMLAKFSAFDELGQLSVFSPFPEYDKGEIWIDKPHSFETRGGVSLAWAEGNNVGSTAMVRRQLLETGISWSNREGKYYRFPSDGQFSRAIKAQGYRIAWSDEYLVCNWGHNVAEWRAHLDYYVKNYESKESQKLAGMEKRLNDLGYAFLREGDEIVDIVAT